MLTTADTQVRELDSRRSDGIEVTLLWNPEGQRVSVAVNDERSGESIEFPVARQDALTAFRHPYAYLDALAA
jgi:YD repeat-containing protein